MHRFLLYFSYIHSLFHLSTYYICFHHFIQMHFVASFHSTLNCEFRFIYKYFFQKIFILSLQLLIFDENSTEMSEKQQKRRRFIYFDDIANLTFLTLAWLVLTFHQGVDGVNEHNDDAFMNIFLNRKLSPL
jgi:hypothetical protein